MRELGDRFAEAATWDSLGHAHHQLGDHPSAIAAYRQSIDLCRQLGDRYYEATCQLHDDSRESEENRAQRHEEAERHRETQRSF